MQAALRLIPRSRQSPKAFIRSIARLPPLSLPSLPLPGLEKPTLWLNDRFKREHWLSDDFTLTFEPTLPSLHQLILEHKLATAYRVLCTLQNQGKDIPHDLIFLDAALGELNTLSSATHGAFYAWLSLVPARHHENSPGMGRNPFRLFHNTLYRSGSPSRDLEVILGMVKIASSKGYFFEEFRRAVPLMTRLVQPSIGLALMLELEKSYIEYVGSIRPQHLERHAFLVRKTLILGCHEAPKGRWMDVAMELLKLSKQEGIPVPTDLARSVEMYGSANAK